MTGPRSHYLTILDHEIHVLEWGVADAPAIVLWHGLTRNARDFDTLARHLGSRRRVIVPDTPGRGLSQWAGDPDRDYSLRVYAAQAQGLADALGLERFDWIGTSMGGLIGIICAAGPLRGRIGKMILNDIGPLQPDAAIGPIVTYAGNPPAFATMRQVEAYLRKIYASWSPMTADEWRGITEASSRRLPDGKLTLNYDPRIVRQLTNHPDERDLWAEWDAISADVLTLRGAQSTVLPRTVADAMQTRGPRCPVIEIPGCGHVPSLNTAAQFALIDRFLEDPS
jgi:pimeloyl-ACP methyl ester carboxylesterase